jgi:cytochrome c oxidase subunit 2
VIVLRLAVRPAVRVDVMAFQWCRRFGHSQQAQPVGVTADCRDGRIPTLVVPTGRTVEVHITSEERLAATGPELPGGHRAA